MKNKIDVASDVKKRNRNFRFRFKFIVIFVIAVLLITFIIYMLQTSVTDII